MTKKEPGLLFHFHVLTCLNLGQTKDLTRIQMGIKIQKRNQKKKTKAHKLLM
jgi:hypothetical protein